MKIALTGATGFTGSFTLPLLLQQGHDVKCFVRRREAAQSLIDQGATVAIGDLGDVGAAAEAFRGCDALVNIASLGFGHAEGIIAAAKQAGVGRTVFVSTTAIFTSLNAPSKAVRVAAENAVRRSGSRWTILRPTMIYGTDRDRNICRLIWFLRYSPILPVFGRGESLMQPIYVADLARAICSAITSPAAENNAYNVSGAEPITYNALVRTVARLMGRRVWICHLPYKPAVAALGFTERKRIRLPIKAEQILRLQEDKAFPSADAVRDFQFKSRCFAEGVSEELAGLGLLKS